MTPSIIPVARRFARQPEPSRSKALADLAYWYDVPVSVVRRMAGLDDYDSVWAGARVANLAWWAVYGGQQDADETF